MSGRMEEKKEHKEGKKKRVKESEERDRKTGKIISYLYYLFAHSHILDERESEGLCSNIWVCSHENVSFSDMCGVFFVLFCF